MLGLALAPWACRSQPTAVENGPGTMSVVWSGKYSGRFAAPATASWCAVDTMLQVEAIRGDTGVSFVLFEKDTLAQGPRPVVAPEVNVNWRPMAAAALRWFNDTDILGFTGKSGVVSVTATDSGATGTVDVSLRGANQVDTVHLSGTFTAVPVRPAVGACGRVTKWTGK